MNSLIIDNYRFINEAHKQAYLTAKNLLEKEAIRQRADYERLHQEWKHQSAEEQSKNLAWLKDHFDCCKEAYIKLIIDCLTIATPVITFSSSDPEAKEKD